jgi:hypothetical protein
MHEYWHGARFPSDVFAINHAGLHLALIASTATARSA